jgi:hypothetical protein
MRHDPLQLGRGLAGVLGCALPQRSRPFAALREGELVFDITYATSAGTGSGRE